MKAIILAAGQGQRMKPLTAEIPKALLPITDETVLARLIRQLRANNVTDITVVAGFAMDKLQAEVSRIANLGSTITVIENARYEEDINIYSVLLATAQQKEPYILIEGDIVFDDSSIAELCARSTGKHSLWFTHGSFSPSQSGGILLTKSGTIHDIRIVPKFETKFLKYKKLLGAMAIGQHEVARFRELLEEYAKRSIRQYYLQPWMEHLDELPCREVDLQANIAVSFNTVEDFRRATLLIQGGLRQQVELIPVKQLKHIEGFSQKRVDWLKNKILREGVWTQPLKIEGNHNLVLDGQHRFEVAKALGLEHIPCQLYNYDEVEVWSLRPKNHPVERGQVIERSLSGDIYPYKTVKHRFPNPARDYTIAIEKLGHKKS